MDKPKPDAALLLIDVINDLASDQIDDLPRHARSIIDPILTLREQADAAGLPTIYVNDNFGDWHRDANAIVEHCHGQGGEVAAMIDRLRPRDRDFFVVKPRFSGFYATSLPVLLPRFGVTRLILAGIAADICVMFTAADAHMREYDLWVPTDAVASNRAEHRDWALGIMAKSMSAETRSTAELRLRDWLGKAEVGANPAQAEVDDEVPA